MRACKQIIPHFNKDPWSLPWITSSPHKCHGATGHGERGSGGNKTLNGVKQLRGKGWVLVRENGSGCGCLPEINVRLEFGSLEKAGSDWNLAAITLRLQNPVNIWSRSALVT